MDQLADQASDLRSYLTNAAPSPMNSAGFGAAYSPGPPLHIAQGQSQQYRTPPAYNSAYGDNSAPQPQHHDSGSKRKSAEDDESSTPNKQQRSKRNRYTSIACNECKRRKIRCNGETPCQRCGNLSLECLYAPNCCTTNFKDSDEFKSVREKVARLEEQLKSLDDIREQLRSLTGDMTTLRGETTRLGHIHDRILPLPSQAVTPSPSASSLRSLPKPSFAAPRVPPSFSGPTSINFTVDMAKTTLHNMQRYSNAGEGQETPAAQVDASPSPSPTLNPIVSPASRRPADPLWDFDKDEMVRLCRLHEEEVGIMYPVVKIEETIEHAKFLANYMEAAKKNGLVPPFGQDEGISDLKTLTLKVVMCCALVVEEHGCSAKATELYESIAPIVDRKLMSDPVDVDNLPFLALVAGYRFLSNEEILAWRVIGQLCRLCMELGLHRREGLEKIEDEGARRNALMTFWSAYVLDRRWSFGTGLPCVCDDDKIDPKLPMPETRPYLVAMITYSRIGAKIWKLVDYFEPAVVRELKRKDFDQLDSEILNWYDTVPEEIKVASLGRDVPMPSGPAYNTQRLQIWTRLRLNQIRLWLHTPVLHSASSIIENQPLAQKAVDLAKETIKFMTTLNNTSNLYRKNQVFYHQFLTSAISVLFLASTHAPMLFSSQCRTEFYMGLELIKDMSARSWVSQRIWRTVRSLKAYAPRLGLGEDDQQQRSGAAMTMAGLASGNMSSSSAGAQQQQHTALPPLPPLQGHNSRTSSSSSLGVLNWQAVANNHPSGIAMPQPRSPAVGSRLAPHRHSNNSQQQQHPSHPFQPAPHSTNTNTGSNFKAEDPENGQRLGEEMSLIYETFTNGHHHQHNKSLGHRRGGDKMPVAALGQNNNLHNMSSSSGGQQPLTRPGSGAGQGVSPAGMSDGDLGLVSIVRDLF